MAEVTKLRPGSPASRSETNAMERTRLRMPRRATKLQKRIDKAEEIARPVPRSRKEIGLAERKEKDCRAGSVINANPRHLPEASRPHIGP